jgi:hypothetical protein
MFNMKNDVKGQESILDNRWIDELHKSFFVGPSGTATTFGWFAGHLKSGILVIFKSGGQPGVATRPLYAPVGKPRMGGFDQPIRRQRTMLRRVQQTTRRLLTRMATA